MSEQPVVYSELKQKKSSQPLPKRPKTDKSEDSEWEQEVNYAELKLHRPSQQQSNWRRVEGKGESGQIVKMGLPHKLAHSLYSGCCCSPCPEKWFLHRKSCYFFSEERKTWNQSRAACGTQNSSLLKIEDQEMLDFLSRFYLLGWIGLLWPGVTRAWIWTDNSNLPRNLLAGQVIPRG
uniref:Natural killer cells antigen CD94 n=1 Tax=Ornithorhynchus anatinus TaxID=9258 RepID=F6RRL7_ORNAN